MPLKQPKSIPKLPKTRKKTIDALKKSTPLKKKGEVEYVINFYFKYDKVQGKQFYVVRINTVKEFSNLNYGIAVDVRKKKEVIDISLLGLNMRQSYLVNPQPAFTDLMFEDLYGQFQVNLIKQDGSINTADVDFNVFKKEIKIVKDFVPAKKNNGRFCTFMVDENSFTFEK